jgi:hypothetical protein
VADAPPKSVSGLGIASLVVGLVALTITWIPCLGFVGIVPAVIGAILGLVGLIVSLAGGKSSASFPIAGILVSGVAIALPFVWVYIIGAGIQEADRQRKEEEAKGRANAQSVTVAELLDAYDANAVAADEKYKDKWLIVTGEVDRVEKELGDLSVTLKDKNRAKVGEVQCSFSNDHKDAVAGLKAGDTVKIAGKCGGKFLFNVTLRHCELGR